jgi:hypothetical protein
MAKIDLNALSIDELVALRDNAIDKLAEKVLARQAELQLELERLSQYGKPTKKPASAAPARPRKSDSRKSDDDHSDEKISVAETAPISQAA